MLNLLNISSVCRFKAEGFEVSFNFQELEIEEKCLICIIKLSFETQLKTPPIERTNCHISVKDLQRLNSYFDNHIENLKTKPIEDSFDFVNQDLDFILQALNGEIEGNEGAFSIRFVLNIGNSEKKSRVYAGAEGAVSLAEVIQFQSLITKMLSKLPK